MKISAPLVLALGFSLVSAGVLPTFNLQSDSAYTLNTDLVSTCGDANDLLEIKDITFNPDPPRKGEKLEINFTGFLKEEVPEGSTVDVVVKFGVVQLLKKRYDFCEEIEKIDEGCPIPKGDLSYSKEIDLPNEIPPGKYQVHAVVTTPDLKRVTCLDGRVAFPRK